MKSHPLPKKRSLIGSFLTHPSAEWIILGISLLLTAAAWQISTNAIQAKAIERFDFQSHAIAESVAKRMFEYEAVLRGGAGFFNASEDVTRSEWQRYVRDLRIQKLFPGIQGIGFSVMLPGERVAQHIAKVRAEGFPDYAVRPPGVRPMTSTIVFLEPFDWRNKRAFGFDMYSEAVRRAAMDKAMESGEPSISGRVTLVQETEKDVQFGFLMYVPVYAKGRSTATAEERRAAIEGFVYAPFRAKDLMQGILSRDQLGIDFEIYDGEKLDESSLLFDSTPGTALHALPSREHIDKTAFNQSINIDVLGRTWTIFTHAPIDYLSSGEGALPNIVGSMAVAIDILLFLIVVQFRRSHTGLVRQAEQAKEQVVAQEKFFAQVFEAVPVGITVSAPDGSIVYGNAHSQDILGLPAEEQKSRGIGSPEWKIVRPDGTPMPATEFASVRALSECATFEGVEMGIVRKDGVRWISVNATPSPDPRYGVIVAYSDITEQKQARTELERFTREFEAFLDQTTDFIYFKDQDSRFRFCSQPLARITHHENWREMVGKHDREVFPPDTARIYEEEEIPVFRDGTPLLNRIDPYYDADGRASHVLTNKWPLFDDQGRVIGIFGISRDVGELLRLQKALESSHQELLEAQRVARLGSWTVDTASGRIMWSPNTYNIFGVAESTPVNIEIFAALVHPDDREMVLSEWRQALTTGKYEIEHRVVVNGKTLWVAGRANFQRDDQGKIIGAVGTVQDITERRELEDRLALQRRRLEDILDGTNVGTWEWNVQTGETTFNERWAEIVGYTLAELAPISIETWKKLAHPQDFELSGQLLAEHFSGHTDFYECECRMRHKAGHWVWVLDRGRISTRSKDGAPVLMAGTHQDITARKTAELESIRAKEAAEANNQALNLLYQAINQSNSAIVMTDRDGNIQFVNPAFERITGYGFDEVLGRNPRVLNSRQLPASYYRSLWETISTGRPWHGDLLNRKKNGELFWESATISPVLNPEGAIVNYVAVKDDITERKREQAELIRAKNDAEAANLAKSQFLATMSHEIRTPMNGILGMAQLLMMQGLGDDERKTYARTILNSGQTLLTLLNDILDISKVEAGRLELESAAFSPTQMIDEIAALFSQPARKKGVSLAAHASIAKEQRYWGDPTRLRQILSNLVGNAIKFTERGGVTISVELRGDDVLRFAVADTGIGIDAQQKARLFQPFVQGDSSVTRRYGGTGLGLAISRSLVELMKGRIDVDSVPGGGSTFWFEIPLRRADTESDTRQHSRAAESAPVTGRIDANGRAILLVEDVATNRLIVETYLRKRGFTVHGVEDGRVAVDWLAKNPDVDLVLMDCQMPVLDGCGATREWRALESRERPRKRIPIVALTANVLGDAQADCLAAGMDDFLPKPIDFEQLEAVLARWLSGAGDDATVATPGALAAEEAPPHCDVAALSEELRRRVAELEAALAQRMFKARRIAEAIVADLGDDDCARAFRRIADLTTHMDYEAALAALQALTRAASNNETPVFDETALLTNLDGDRAVAKAIVSSAMVDLPGYAERLDRAIAVADLREAEHIVHTLKGLTAQIGGLRMAELMKTINARLKQGERLTPGEIEATRKEYRSLADALNHWIG